MPLDSAERDNLLDRFLQLRQPMFASPPQLNYKRAVTFWQNIITPLAVDLLKYCVNFISVCLVDGSYSVSLHLDRPGITLRNKR